MVGWHDAQLAEIKTMANELGLSALEILDQMETIERDQERLIRRGDGQPPSARANPEAGGGATPIGARSARGRRC